MGPWPLSNTSRCSSSWNTATRGASESTWTLECGLAPRAELHLLVSICAIATTIQKNSLAPGDHRMAATTKPEINKSQSIRDFLKKNPKVHAKEVVAGLAAKGITVTESHVYEIGRASCRE